MSAARWIEAQGVRVWAKGDSITLEGLDTIRPELASRVLAFAKQNKGQLLIELGGPSGLPARQCLGCGKSFVPSNPVKVYCQAKCCNTCKPKPKKRAWPWPEPGEWPVYSVPWKYALLWAIATAYGAGLEQDARGRLTPTCPATMPPQAAQALRDGYAELDEYVREKVSG